MNRPSNGVSDLLKLTVVIFVFGSQIISAQSDSFARISEHKYVGPGDTQTPDSRQVGTTNPSPLLIGAGDEVEIAVYDAPDLSVHGRVGADGTISMPLIGYVRIAGLTSIQAEEAIESRLLRGKVLN